MLTPGEKIAHYEIENELGEGSQGTVYQVTWKTPRGIVRQGALKIYNTFDTNEILTEFSTWARVSQHPNILTFIDVRIDKANKRFFSVSELASEGDLDKWIAEKGGKPEFFDEAIQIMLGILNGLIHLHENEVVHRDIKPANIFIKQNIPLLADFGLARGLDVTQSGTLGGTLAFMSPELVNVYLKQRVGDISKHERTEADDLWATSATLYKMLTRNYAFDTLDEIRDASVAQIPKNIPNGLGDIVKKSLQKEPNKRFESAFEMREALQNYVIAEQKRILDEKIERERIEAEEKALFAEIERQRQEAETKAAKVKFERDQMGETQPAISEQNSDLKKPVGTLPADWAKLIKEIENNKNHPIKEIPHKPFNPIKPLILPIIGGVVFLVLAMGIYFNWKPESKGNTIANSNINSATLLTQTISNINPPPGMVYVPGGNFLMGRNDTGWEAEKPAHQVIVKPFLIDIYEVTNEQYYKFVLETGYKKPSDWKFGTYLVSQDNLPVVGVDWEDALAYAKWAGKRLPSEEEWEFAARGTDNFIYPWGNDWKPGNANIGSKAFTEVGNYKGVSPFGLYDMIGNAWEWTSSDFKPYPNGKLPNVFNGKTNLKTIRGGSFEATKEFATTTYRIGWAAMNAQTYNLTGFRCAKDVE